MRYKVFTTPQKFWLSAENMRCHPIRYDMVRPAKLLPWSCDREAEDGRASDQGCDDGSVAESRTEEAAFRRTAALISLRRGRPWLEPTPHTDRRQLGDHKKVARWKDSGEKPYVAITRRRLCRRGDAKRRTGSRRRVDAGGSSREGAPMAGHAVARHRSHHRRKAHESRKSSAHHLRSTAGRAYRATLARWRPAQSR
jgi:hypothetical protein